MTNAHTGPAGRTPDYLALTLLVGACQMIVTMDITTMGVLLPAIGQTYAVDPVALGSLVGFSSLVFASMMLIGGWLADSIGPKACVSLGLAIAALGGLCAALSSGFAMLLAGRVLYGLGAAILVPANFSMINTTIPDGAPRARAYGIYGMVQGMALLGGPGLGGLLTTQLGWRAVFWANCALIVVLIVLVRALFPATPRRPVPRFDARGALLFVTGIVALVIGLTGGSGMLTGFVQRIGLVAGGAALLGLFLCHEQTTPAPLMPPAIFRWPGVKTGLLAMLAVLAASAGLFLLPAFAMQRALGFSAQQAGLGMVPHGLTVIVVGQSIGWFMARYPLSRNVYAGLVLLTAGLFINAFMQPGFGYVPNIMVPMIIGAAGSIFSVIMLSAVITGRVPPEQQGIISAVTFTAQQIGIAIGTVVLLNLASAAGDPLRAAGTAFLASAGFAACALITVRMSRGGDDDGQVRT